MFFICKKLFCINKKKDHTNGKKGEQAIHKKEGQMANKCKNVLLFPMIKDKQIK